MKFLIFFLFSVISSPLKCIKETNPCGTQIYNGTIGCCPGLECYEETSCIKCTNTTFGNCYKI